MTSHIILAGGSGFLGRALADHFHQHRREVIILTRKPSHATSTAREVRWDGESLGCWTEELNGAAAVVNLAGRTVNCRYHARNRRQILHSRLNSTRVLGEAIARCADPPTTWINASTATIYRHTFGPAWDETGAIGATPAARDAFSVEVAQAWERKLSKAATPRTRRVALRTAMVLGRGPNSVFPVLRRLARWGLGGAMGSGSQFVSWIHELDFCRAVEFVISQDNLRGPVNLASANPLPSAAMMQLFRELVGVPFGLPATKWMLEIGAFRLRTETELILKSRRVVPGKLLASGFQFRFPTLREALADLA